MPLTDVQIRALQPKDKAYKLFDGGGLYLLVHPEGYKYWKLKYRFAGKEDKASFGVYPDVSLREARELREDAKRHLRNRRDPKLEMQRDKHVGEKLFETVAREWIATLHQQTDPNDEDKKSEQQIQDFIAPLGPRDTPKPKDDQKEVQYLCKKTVAVKVFRLETYVLPFIGRRYLTQVESSEVVRIARKIEARRYFETAHRVAWMIDKIFRFAKAAGDFNNKENPARDISEALTPVITTNHAALTDPADVGALLRSIDGYNGQPTTQILLKLEPYVILRNTEIRAGTWDEINFEAGEWRVPKQRMKMGDYHVVPLSTQAIALLRELHLLTGHGRLMFPGLRSTKRPISNNTYNAALRRMGYSTDQMTQHGWRTVFDTFMNELDWNSDAIELQLAHKERKKSRAAYNKAQKLTLRRDLMQAYADYLDKLRTSNVVQLFAKCA